MTTSRAEREFHRKTAVAAFNSAWGYLDKSNRSPDDDIHMLQLAHASSYHWGLVGTPLNQAIGDWQISRVYAALGQPDLALRYAKLSLSACEKNGLEEMMPSAHEAIARAYAVAKDPENAGESLAKALQLLVKTPLGLKDWVIYVGQISATRRLIDTISGSSRPPRRV